MSANYRLPTGGRIDRSRPVRFEFDGQSYTGFFGDTLASALLANGVTLVGRSFKYHRPRGILAAGVEEPNALVQLERGAYTEPNTRATSVELYDGLRADSQNRWPSLKYDIGVVNSGLSRFFPAGFYYKTFMWPERMWMTYEHVIRRAAGLGVAPKEPDPDRYEHRYDQPDLLVVGAGPAGLACALAASRAGKRVVLVDESAELGGALLGDTAEIDGKGALDWVAEVAAELAAADTVRVLTRTTLTGYFDYNYLIATEHVTAHLGPQRSDAVPRQRLWKLRAKQVVLATGAIERPLVFADNDRPGVMLASAVRTYQHRYGVLPGNAVVVFTNNDSAYATAVDAAGAGRRVTLVDCRASGGEEVTERARSAGVELVFGSAVTGVHYRGGIQGVDVMSLSADGRTVSGDVRRIDCDLVCSSGGWNPAVHLHSQAKGKLRWCDETHTFAPAETAVTMAHASVGACNGSLSLSQCLREGWLAGGGEDGGPRAEVSPAGAALRPLWVVPTDHPVGEGPKKHFHEFQNDATAADLLLAQREGFESIEHTKRYTTTGMATDQGKTSNVNAIGIVAESRGVPVPSIGVTTFRPPYTPLTFGAVVGQNRRHLFHMVRKTPMHAWSEAQGAVFEDVGDWKRARYYPRGGEDMDAAVRRECKAVREGVGLFDASTLGKIDLQGPDTAWLLEMLYTNAWQGLAVGKCRYGLMLNEHGMVFDDGVTSRLGEHHYHMTTTTGGAARVMGWIEEWLQTEWPDKRVYATSVTEQWAVMALNGPRSRELLQKLTDDDVSNDALPFMSCTAVTLAGAPARVFRISFTGEQSFEINVPARYGRHVWEALVAAGADMDLVLYGTETMHVLRAEKGFIIVGQDSDGTMTPADLGMDWIVSKKKPDFLGKRSLSRSDTARDGRKQLVGLLTEDPELVLPEGAHIVSEVRDAPPMPMLGHVTSSYYSPNVDGGRSIAMAVVADGFNRKGNMVDLALIDGRAVRAKVVDPVFVDPAGERVKS
ncbi:MAG: sarcosine oxidase subunit alpha family protein [Pseudomonadota bacterium]